MTSAPMDASPEPEAADAFSQLTPAKRNHPLFRRGYNLGYSQGAHEAHLTELELHGPQIRRAQLATGHKTFGIADGPKLDQLKQGVRILREVNRLNEDTVRSETPCCGRQIKLPMADDDLTQLVMCCRHRLLYRVGLAEEESEGWDDEPSYVAVFVVEELDVAVAEHRAGKREAVKGKSRRSGRRPRSRPGATQPADVAGPGTASRRRPHPTSSAAPPHPGQLTIEMLPHGAA